MSSIPLDLSILLEIGKNTLPGLQELDNLFGELKKSKTTSEDDRLRKKLEAQMETLFGPPFSIDFHYLGNLSDNCAVIPIIKGVGKIEKTQDFIKLGNVRKVYIILGMSLVKELTPRELTSIFLHEIGHIVNHLSSSLSSLASFANSASSFLNIMNSIPGLNLIILPLYIITSRTLFFTQHIGEYHADKFAVEYGYGDELISVMHKWHLQTQEYNSQRTFWQLLSHIKSLIFGSSHPSDKNRILKIAEEIRNNYANQYKSPKLQKILTEYYS